MNNIYILDIETYLKICELAIKNGKQTGDNMQEEFEEYIKNKTHIKKIEVSNDIDLLKGNLREAGYHKILDLTNLERGIK